MQLVSIQQFREKYFEPASRPSVNTIRKWIDEDEIEGGRRIGKKYYVDCDQWEDGEDTLVNSVLS